MTASEYKLLTRAENAEYELGRLRAMLTESAFIRAIESARGHEGFFFVGDPEDIARRFFAGLVARQ